MAINFMVKMGEIRRLTFILRLGISERSRTLQFRFQKIHADSYIV